MTRSTGANLANLVKTIPTPFLVALLLPGFLVLAGTVGYCLIEQWSILDSIYMTVITLTTVGFREVHPLSPAGRVFTMLLTLGGVFTIFHAAGSSIRWIVSGEMRAILGSRRMERQLSEMRDHVIVCGLGRMGRLVCKDFDSQNTAFVVIEQDAELVESLDFDRGMILHGDATSDECLTQAGIDRARALVTVAGSDAINLYVVMTARLLNDQLFIVARAEESMAEQKLVRAGATRVISAYAIGGSRVAEAVLRPNVVDFLEFATRTDHLELSIEETRLSRGSPFVGTSLLKSHVRDELGLIIVAIKKPTGKMTFNPPPASMMEEGDILIALGPRQNLDRLSELAGVQPT